LLALLAIGSAVGADAHPPGLSLVEAQLTRLDMDVGCGWPPSDPRPCPPPRAQISVEMPVVGCSAEGFELRVRQRANVQVVAIYLKDSAGCIPGTWIVTPDGELGLSRFRFESYDILPDKPLRILNPIPVWQLLRP
jgi:hypothetical protein